jgi:hypothetical protein
VKHRARAHRARRSASSSSSRSTSPPGSASGGESGPSSGPGDEPGPRPRLASARANTPQHLETVARVYRLVASFVVPTDRRPAKKQKINQGVTP